jgi:hypothetical protein
MAFPSRAGPLASLTHERGWRRRLLVEHCWAGVYASIRRDELPFGPADEPSDEARRDMPATAIAGRSRRPKMSRHGPLEPVKSS